MQTPIGSLMADSSPFDFTRYSWPPSDTIPLTRFQSRSEYIDSGTFRAVYKAIDSFTHQPLVFKKFRDFNPLHERYWSEDIHASREARRLAKLFNEEMKSNKPITFILPYIDECLPAILPPFTRGEKILVEPYLGKDVYKKFNSNSGWEDKSCGFSMGAFSHFTYHITGGAMLVCDLQGIKRDNEYILTDPVICSVKQSFGVTDLGEAGIRSFFAHHDCTSLCKGTWKKHGSPKPYPKVIIGTTYLLR